MSQAARIEDTLRALVAAGPFYQRTRDRNTKAVTLGVTHIAPDGVIVNEQSSQIGPARRNRTRFAFERRNWRWTVSARFNCEVSIYAFERAVTDSPPRLDRDVANGLEQVHLRLVSADYRHPVEQSSSSGSQVTFNFEADLSPA